jgi:hypothetical protein
MNFLKPMNSANDFDKIPHDFGDWHGPMPRPPAPREPEPGLSYIARLHWHVREYFRPKSDWERIGIKLAKAQKQ